MAHSEDVQQEESQAWLDPGLTDIQFIGTEIDDLGLVKSGLAEVDNRVFLLDNYRSSTGQVSGFLALPAEVRHHIFSYLLPHSREIVIGDILPDPEVPRWAWIKTTGKRDPFSTAIMRVNRQLFRETSQYVYHNLEVYAGLRSEIDEFEGCSTMGWKFVPANCNDQTWLGHPTCLCPHFPFHKIKKLRIDLFSEGRREHTESMRQVRGLLIRLCLELQELPPKKIEVNFWDDSYFPVLAFNDNVPGKKVSPPKSEGEIVEEDVDENLDIWPFSAKSWRTSSCELFASYKVNGSYADKEVVTIWDFYNDPEERDLFFWCDHFIKLDNDFDAYRQTMLEYSLDIWENPGDHNIFWLSDTRRPLDSTFTELELLLQPLRLLRNIKTLTINLTPVQSRSTQANDLVADCIREASGTKPVETSFIRQVDEQTEVLAGLDPPLTTEEKMRFKILDFASRRCRLRALGRQSLSRILRGRY